MHSFCLALTFTSILHVNMDFQKNFTKDVHEAYVIVDIAMLLSL